MMISCISNPIRQEITDADRDRFWQFCHFQVIDHECGLITDDGERSQCIENLRTEYHNQPRNRYRAWLRNRGCPSSVIETANIGNTNVF